MTHFGGRIVPNTIVFEAISNAIKDSAPVDETVRVAISTAMHAHLLLRVNRLPAVLILELTTSFRLKL